MNESSFEDSRLPQGVHDLSNKDAEIARLEKRIAELRDQVQELNTPQQNEDLQQIIFMTEWRIRELNDPKVSFGHAILRKLRLAS